MSMPNSMRVRRWRQGRSSRRSINGVVLRLLKLGIMFDHETEREPDTLYGGG